MKKTVSKHHRITGKSQSDLIMGTNGPMRRDPEFMSASIGNNILGQFGMMGRFGDVVREKSGDRKSTRLNSSHLVISYAVFCLKKKSARCSTLQGYKTQPTL